MDTSKKYILMCEKAIEIQELYSHEPDTLWASYEEDTPDLVSIRPGDRISWAEEMGPKKHFVWLPRQDELQDIVRGKNQCSTMLIEFIAWWKEANTNMLITMEQIWLAFVMYKKYNKIWNGKDWEVKNDPNI